MENVELKEIPGWDGYFASKCGFIWSNKYKTLRPIKGCLNKWGYFLVSLSEKNDIKTRRVSRLVAMAWIPNPDNKKEVNHIDGNKLNNNVSNLEWTTRSENMIHSTRILKKNIGTQNGLCKLTEDQVKEIRSSKDSTRAIAKKYGISQSTASDVKAIRHWKHLK